jgi:hypothetical protein
VFLIDTEVGFNVMRLGGASKGPPSNVIPHLRTDFWDASQARLAHLLPTGDMKVLAPYYEQIRACLRNLMTSQPKMIRAGYLTANGH